MTGLVGDAFRLRRELVAENLLRRQQLMRSSSTCRQRAWGRRADALRLRRLLTHGSEWLEASDDDGSQHRLARRR